MVLSSAMLQPAMAAAPVTEAANPMPLATQLVQQAKAECAAINNGQFATSEHTITLHDITGDGRPEEFVDGSQFSCSSAIMWRGSGGSPLWVIVDGKAHQFLAQRWKVVHMDKQPILLLSVYFSQCSDTVAPCYRALVWDDGDFVSTRRPL
ncbi:hypothetical protein [Shewanella sp. YIC-542]|uniref:hypothetical protein n=1 Tax=Shewanella mytili TaxID=3377111 RepID=UPI00398F2FE9